MIGRWCDCFVYLKMMKDFCVRVCVCVCLCLCVRVYFCLCVCKCVCVCVCVCGISNQIQISKVFKFQHLRVTDVVCTTISSRQPWRPVYPPSLLMVHGIYLILIDLEIHNGERINSNWVSYSMAHTHTHTHPHTYKHIRKDWFIQNKTKNAYTHTHTHTRCEL